MFRTALLSTLAALGLGSAASAQVYFPQAPVGRPGYGSYYPGHVGYPRPPRVRTYEVEYRARSCDRWRVYAVTADHDYAHRLVRSLKHQGYEARVDH